jgi:hypothetical protein
MELWKQIPNSKYEASSLGRIRGPKGNILKPFNHPLGYHLVGVKLDHDPKTKTRTVHSLIALTFHGPRPEGLDIAHGNCIKTDNRPSNLRYATRSENLRDSHAMGVNRGGRPFIYPWDILEVGQTFTSSPLIRASIQRQVWAASRRGERSFNLAKAANDDGSWTVTRVA